MGGAIGGDDGSIDSALSTSIEGGKDASTSLGPIGGGTGVSSTSIGCARGIHFRTTRLRFVTLIASGMMCVFEGW